MSLLKIAQITDIHIGPEDILYNNINVRTNFLRVLESIKTKNVDYLIISGDLAIDFGEIEAYYWLKDQLSEYPVPFLIMAGNHDSVERLDKVFNLNQYIKNGMLYYEKVLKGFPILFLDSEPGKIHPEQLSWLEEKTKEKEDKEILLFIHHPPAYMGCQFMDSKYPLRNINEVQTVLAELNNVNHIFCGHYHCALEKKMENHTIYVSPATQMQIDENHIDFKLKSTNPGYRLMEWDGKNMITEVIML